MIKFFIKLYRKLFHNDLKNFYVHCYLISKDVGVLQEYLQKNNNSDAARRYIIQAKYNFSKISPLYYTILKHNTNKYDNKTRYLNRDLITIYNNDRREYEWFTGVKFYDPRHCDFYANSEVIWYDSVQLPFTKLENKLFQYTFKFQEHYVKKLNEYRAHEKVSKTLNADF